MSWITVEITSTRGSAPRNAGAVMKVTPRSIMGTIGGGALEFQAIATARAMIEEGKTEYSETLPLGPNLGQCCGGMVTLRYSTERRATDPINMTYWRLGKEERTPIPLWIWGAGHVGRAVLRAAPAAAFDIKWIDSSAARFPRRVPDHVSKVPAADMPRLASHTPPDVHHLIFTYSHDIDLALCAALLGRDAASIGLIGSKTKWARFQKRMRDMGLDPTPITCPIGDKRLGKAPDQIAKGTIGALLKLPQPKAIA